MAEVLLDVLATDAHIPQIRLVKDGERTGSRKFHREAMAQLPGSQASKLMDYQNAAVASMNTILKSICVGQVLLD
jgi:hypothetical protein